MRERPLVTEGNCSRCRLQGRREVRKHGHARQHVGNRARVRGSKCGPRVASRNAFGGGHEAPALEQSRERFHRHVSKIRLRRDRRHARAPVGREAIENLDQLQLIVEIVLEPEHDFIEATGQRRHARAAERLLEHAVAIFEVPGDQFTRPPAAAREEIRSLLAKRGRSQPRRHRPFVEHVIPRHDLAGDAGSAHVADDRCAVGQVKRFLSDRSRRGHRSL